jgi:hypothetical protein
MAKAIGNTISMNASRLSLSFVDASLRRRKLLQQQGVLVSVFLLDVKGSALELASLLTQERLNMQMKALNLRSIQLIYALEQSTSLNSTNTSGSSGTNTAGSSGFSSSGITIGGIVGGIVGGVVLCSLIFCNLQRVSKVSPDCSTSILFDLLYCFIFSRHSMTSNSIFLVHCYSSCIYCHPQFPSSNSLPTSRARELNPMPINLI